MSDYSGFEHESSNPPGGISCPPSATCRTPAPRSRSRPRTDLTERVDDLDALIWAAARATDDPQLAVVRARELAESVFIGLVLTIGSGAHRLNCSVPTPSGPVTAGEDLRLDIATEIPAVGLPASGAERELCELFALAHVSGADATVILRSRPLLEPDAGVRSPRIRGPRLAHVRRQTTPIDAAGMFAFCCSEASSGEPLPLDPNTRYVDARSAGHATGPGLKPVGAVGRPVGRSRGEVDVQRDAERPRRRMRTEPQPYAVQRRGHGLGPTQWPGSWVWKAGTPISSSTFDGTALSATCVCRAT